MGSTPPVPGVAATTVAEVQVAVPDAACVTVYVLSATVIVPVRAEPGFTSTVYVTVPDPGPLPDVTWIHELAVVAVHVQELPVATLNEPLPPLAATVPLLDGSIV
jgi:hypothetical protein